MKLDMTGSFPQFRRRGIWSLLLTLTVITEGLGQSLNSKNTSGNEFNCLKSHSETSSAELSCKSEMLVLLDKQEDAFVEATAHRGAPFENLRQAFRDVNRDMKTNYAQLIRSVGRNIFPLIVASDCENEDLCGVGGTFKLYLKDGSMKRSSKVPDEFEIFKFLSHMVLGVFTIVSPYFKAPHSTSFIPPLRVYQAKAKSACEELPFARGRLNHTGLQAAFAICKYVNEYVQLSITAEKVNEVSYTAFAKKLVPHIEICMQECARIQTAHIVPILRKWKSELKDEWRKTYVVIPTVWGVSSMNVRLQLLEQVMDFEQMKQQVLIAEGTRSEDEAVATLGRIVADRTVARLVFGGIDDENAKDHQFSLSTRRDILSTYAGKAIREQCQRNRKNKKNGCPMTKHFATML